MRVLLQGVQSRGRPQQAPANTHRRAAVHMRQVFAEILVRVQSHATSASAFRRETVLLSHLRTQVRAQGQVLSTSDVGAVCCEALTAARQRHGANMTIVKRRYYRQWTAVYMQLLQIAQSYKRRERHG